MTDQVTQGVKALLEGTELTNEAKDELAGLVEMAVDVRVREGVAQERVAITEELEKLYESRYAHDIAKLVEATDLYLAEAAEKWLEDNKIAIESAAKVQRAEKMFESIKALLADNNMDINESANREIDAAYAEVKKIDEELMAVKDENATLKKQIVETKLESILNDACKGLTESQAEKLRFLAEGVTADSIDGYRSKLEGIKKVAFTQAERVDESKKVADDLTGVKSEVITEGAAPESKPASRDPRVARIAEALNRL